MKIKSNLFLAIIGLIALSFVLFLGKSYENTLRGIDSNIHAKVSLNVTDHGLLPHLPMRDTNEQHLKSESNFNDHPFFMFWVNGWIMRALGPSSWSARILTASFSTGCVLLTFYLGSLLCSDLFGFIAALLLLTTRDIILTGATFSLDPPMMFFVLLSFIFWQKDKWRWVGVATGIGLWIKTPVVLLVFPSAFLVAALQGRLKKTIRPLLFSLFFALILGSLIWLATGILGGWFLVKDYWMRQVWGTAVGGRNNTHASDPWMFFELIRTGFLPWLPLLCFSIFEIIRKKLWRIPVVLISIVSISIVAIAITLVRARMGYYYNPVFPFLAFLSAYSIIELVKRFEDQIYSAFNCTVPIFLAFLLCTPTTLGPEAFIALKKFIPFIQSYGHCDDKILLIPGGEPIGSSMDYQLVLNFYADRSVDIVSCASASSAIQKNQPRWIILSGQNLEKCIALDTLQLFKTQIQVGNQYLLTNLIPENSKIDLTVLERELKPAFDCKPATYPKDIYHHYY